VLLLKKRSIVLLKRNIKMCSGKGMKKPAEKKRKKLRTLGWGAFSVLFILGTVLFVTEVNPINFAQANEIGVPYYFKLSVDPGKHDDYGFTCPATYQFSIPSGSSNLKAHKKYAESGDWIQIIEKTSTDFFNGIEAVRFDYPVNRAYISVAFSDASDEIFLKIVDELEDPVATYEKITKYYDNRDAAVVFSADDWDGNDYIDWSFREVCDMFTRKKLWISVGIITEGYHDDPRWGATPPPEWSRIQEKLDAGYIEVVSHSRTHPQLVPYDDYDSEIGGSKQDIIDNLDLPSLYKKGSREYIWGFTAPHSRFDETMHSKLGRYKYLTLLAGSPYREPKYYQDGSFPPWDARHGLYERWNRWAYLEKESLSVLNYEFDQRTSAGKIYHIGLHPWALDLSSGGKIEQHTDYVQGKKNLWYVGYAALMMYHYIEDQKVVTVEDEYEPVLSWTGESHYQEDGLNPEIGKSETNFIYRVKYVEQDNDAPAEGFPKLHILKGGSEISGSPFNMSEVDAEDIDYTDGKIYTYTKAGLNDGTDYTYYFEAYDIHNKAATGDPTNEKAGPVVDNTTPKTFLDEKPEEVVEGNVGEVAVGFIWHGEDDITSEEDLVYSYKLIGYDTDWSGWSSNSTVTYLLSRGNYTFYVRAKDRAGNYPDESSSDTAQCSFTIVLAIVPYPNPCDLSQGQIIKIANLYPNSEVRIYSISGELIRILEEGVDIEVKGELGEAVWDGKDEEGQQVSRGIYICLVISAGGEKYIGKIAIID